MRNSNFKLRWRGNAEPTACAILGAVHSLVRKARFRSMFSEPTSIVIYAHPSGGRRHGLDGGFIGEVDGPVKVGRLALRV